MRTYLLVLYLLLGISVFAQNTKRDSIDFSQFSGMNLPDALNYLSDSYDLAFSYSPESLAEIRIPRFQSDVFSISEFLSLTLADTGIEYVKIADTFVLYPKADEVADSTAVRRNFAISGVVRDKNTRESLPYASIAIQGTKLTTTSNTDGKFTLLNIPSDTLRIAIRYLGYMPLSQSLRGVDDAIAVFEMTPRRRNLPSVEVTAQNQELVEILPEASQLSFNPGQISNLPNLGENDVFSALRRLPGISGGLDASSGLKIRGGNSDENLFFFDGITIYHVDHFYGYLSAFNTGIIKNIRIDKGGYRAKYGGRASGVVNITGIDGNKVKPGFRAEINTLSANVIGEVPLVKNKASLVVAYRRSITDIIQSPTYKNMFNNIYNSSIPAMDNNTVNVFDSENEPDFLYEDFNAKVNFKPSEKDAISLSYYQGEDKTKIQFDGTFEGLERKAFDNTEWGTNGIAAKWSRKWNKRLYTYANYSASRYRSNLEAEDLFFLAGSDDPFSKVYYEQYNRINDNTLRIDNAWEINPDTRLEFGYWDSRYAIELQAQNQTEVLLDSTTSASLHAGYAELYRSFNKLDLSLGMRASYYTRTGKMYWEPRFSFEYPLGERLQLKGAYGIYHQIIRRLNERSLYLSIPETWTLSGNSTVPVLRSDHYILGLLYQKNDWQLDFEAYHKYEKGSVDFLFPEFGFDTGDIEQYAIGGNRRINGLDITVKRSFTHQNILLGYSYMVSESKYPDVNRGEYFRSSGIAQHELNLIYNYEWKRWDFSAAFVLTSGQPYTPVLGTYIITLPNGEDQQFVSVGEINSAELDWYNRLDLGVNYTIPLKKGVFQVGASIYNVYNKLGIKYIDYFQIPDEETGYFAVGQRNISSLGFTPSLYLKIKI